MRYWTILGTPQQCSPFFRVNKPWLEVLLSLPTFGAAAELTLVLKPLGTPEHFAVLYYSAWSSHTSWNVKIWSRSKLGSCDWNKWERKGVVWKTEKQQAFDAVAILPSWHGKKLLQIINSLNRNQQGKKKKKRNRSFNKKFEKLGGRDCLKSIPVFSLFIVPSVAGSKGLQVQGKGDQVRHWSRNVEWRCLKCLHHITRQYPRHLFPPLKPIGKSRKLKDKWDHRQIKRTSQSLFTDLKWSATFH